MVWMQWTKWSLPPRRPRVNASEDDRDATRDASQRANAGGSSTSVREHCDIFTISDDVPMPDYCNVAPAHVARPPAETRFERRAWWACLAGFLAHAILALSLLILLVRGSSRKELGYHLAIGIINLVCLFAEFAALLLPNRAPLATSLIINLFFSILLSVSLVTPWTEVQPITSRAAAVSICVMLFNIFAVACLYYGSFTRFHEPAVPPYRPCSCVAHAPSPRGSSSLFPPSFRQDSLTNAPVVPSRGQSLERSDRPSRSSHRPMVYMWEAETV